jgi:hypothetical protein
MQETNYSASVTRESYDRMADEFARRFGDEYAHKPLEREVIERFAQGVSGRGG